MDASIEGARAAHRRNDWPAVRRALEPRLVDDLELADVDLLATAAYLTGDADRAFDLWGRAYQRAVYADPNAAARSALALARCLGFTGDLARSRGWASRVGHLVDRADVDAVVAGHLAHISATLGIFESGDLVGAHEGFARAAAIADRCSDHELVALARIGLGRMLVYEGEVDEGQALLDEAMVSVESRELGPLLIGDAYCTVIDACTELFDMARCRAWTDSFSRWCDEQSGLVLFGGHCRLHRAEVMLLEGRWDEAEDEVVRASALLARPLLPSTLAGARYVEAELLRLRDRREEAEASYREVSDLGGRPQPGLALLRVAQGRLAPAVGATRRVLAETEGPVQRAGVLGAAAEVLMAAGELETCDALATELASIGTDLRSPLLSARASRARGAVLLARGQPVEALVELRRAVDASADLGVRYELARTRALVGEACAAVGDVDGAELESAAARTLFAELGAAGPEDRPGSAPAPPDGLTTREVEVLRVLARGTTNRVIAQELFISEKTVASHVSHIFTKLGVSSRSAATAYAYDHGLV